MQFQLIQKPRDKMVGTSWARRSLPALVLGVFISLPLPKTQNPEPPKKSALREEANPGGGGGLLHSPKRVQGWGFAGLSN